MLDKLLDSPVMVSLVSGAFATLGIYITIKVKAHVVGKNRSQQPKDRMDTIFDGYESLIRQQQKDIDRKSNQLDQTQHIIERLQEELDKTKEIVRAQQRELEESKEANLELIAQLAQMKQHYTDKAAPVEGGKK